jgi:hypothetical protein
MICEVAKDTGTRCGSIRSNLFQAEYITTYCFAINIYQRDSIAQDKAATTNKGKVHAFTTTELFSTGANNACEGKRKSVGRGKLVILSKLLLVVTAVVDAFLTVALWKEYEWLVWHGLE